MREGVAATDADIGLDVEVAVRGGRGRAAEPRPIAMFAVCFQWRSSVRSASGLFAGSGCPA